MSGPIWTQVIMTREEMKQDWLRFRSYEGTEDYRWLTERIATLFDLKELTEPQDSLVRLALLGPRLTEIPAAAYPNYDAELIASAEREFGPRPSKRKKD